MHQRAGAPSRDRSLPPRAAPATRSASVSRRAAAEGRRVLPPGCVSRTRRRSLQKLSLASASWARIGDPHADTDQECNTCPRRWLVALAAGRSAPLAEVPLLDELISAAALFPRMADYAG